MPPRGRGRPRPPQIRATRSTAPRAADRKCRTGILAQGSDGLAPSVMTKNALPPSRLFAAGRKTRTRASGNGSGAIRQNHGDYAEQFLTVFSRRGPFGERINPGDKGGRQGSSPRDRAARQARCGQARAARSWARATASYRRARAPQAPAPRRRRQEKRGPRRRCREIRARSAQIRAAQLLAFAIEANQFVRGRDLADHDHGFGGHARGWRGPPRFRNLDHGHGRKPKLAAGGLGTSQDSARTGRVRAPASVCPRQRSVAAWRDLSRHQPLERRERSDHHALHRAVRRPHLLEIVELPDLRAEDMDDDVAGVDQHPVAMGQAFDASASEAGSLSFLTS